MVYNFLLQNDELTEIQDRVLNKLNKFYKKQHKNYDNNLNATQRMEAILSGRPLYLHLDDNPNEDDSMKWWCFTPIGNYAVKKYNQPIEYYSSLHNVDTNLIKTIVFLENACGHYLGLNALADYMEVSKSQMPMNIRGDMWENFNGKYYDTNNPNENIELGTLLVKQIYNSLDNPTVDRIITLWNSLGRNTISSFGYRGRKMYNLRPWNL